jgi:menaquinone-dependent protoporphyrinogen oxidase
MTVLVAYSSRHGATAEIARAIGTVLEENGVPAEVSDAERVDGVDRYAGVVLGSAIYMGRWMKPAAELADRRAGDLRSRPVWLFSSGPVGDPPKPSAPDATAIDAIVAATGAREHRVFSGRLDKGALSLKERAAVRFVGAPEGDFREWGAVRVFAGQIAREMRA